MVLKYNFKNNNLFNSEITPYLQYFTVLQISPHRIEDVIKQHPGVAEACVIGIHNAETMELAVGAVMPKPNAKIVAQEIFDLIKGK